MKIDTKKIVDPKVFKEFAAAGGVTNALIKAVDNGLIVVLMIGATERILGQYRGGARIFQSFDGAAALLQQNGIMAWNADTTDWIPRTALKKQNKSEDD